MQKSKIYGSRLLEDNEKPIVPELITLTSEDDVSTLTFDKGAILDANSVSKYLLDISTDMTLKYDTLDGKVTTNTSDISNISTQLTTNIGNVNTIQTKVDLINATLGDYGISLEYTDNKLILKNSNSEVLSLIDCAAFTKDTYLDTITLHDSDLTFNWNTESNKQPVVVDLSNLKDKDGNILSVGNILALSKLLFLSKNDPDTANGLITFIKGIRIGNYTSETGGVIDIDLITGLTYLEVDKLKVRMKAYFETLSIVNELSIAGKWTISPGGSIKCTRVSITPELNYKCYFTNNQDDVQIENNFAVNDLAISKDFNIKTVQYQSATNHYYWRKVLEVGEDYIVLSKTDCDTNSDEPNVGDVICQLGNTTDVDRLNALVFSSVDEQSPCVNLYSGINTYSLADKEYVSYGVDKTTNKAFMNVYGDMYFGDRPTSANNHTGVSFIKYDSTNKKVTIKGELDVLSTVGGTNIDLYIKNNSLSDSDVNTLISNSTVVADLLSLIDGSIETFFYSGVPTLNNLPTSGWVQVATETNKETYANHIGDLYYNKNDGKAYRFMLDSGTGIYSWVIITDVDITKALSDSADALNVANVKKRIFYGTPTVPYDLGDLWVNATYPVGTTKTDVVNNLYYKEILYCITAKAQGGTFSINDWNLSNNYTNMSNSIITDLNGYAYIKAALSNDTLTTGGLILSSLIALRDADGDVLSGINGILSDTALGKGIATWWGGKMIDGGFTPDITTTTVQDYATSLIRFNGSGYLANGAISWDTNGKIHADPTSFFVGPTSIGIITSLFSTIPVDATSYSLVTKIHPTKPFDTLTADTVTATTFIGELQGNAATATKLKTARTIWGKQFDGSGNVSGTFMLDGNSNSVFDIFNDANIVRLQSWNARNLLLNPLGNKVGIGTTAPQYKLDVNGNARISNLLSAAKGGIFYGQDTFPTNVGAYVLNYVSPTYGPRVTAYDGANYQKLSLGKLISGTTFQLELNTDGISKFNGGLISNGVESSKGGIFFGQNAVMPTGLGTYVANYTSDAYGARVLAFDGAAYKDLKLGAMPTSGVFGMSLMSNGDTRVGYNIGTSNFASRVSGWQVNAQGAADFRNIYADELRVQAFTADISQALAGSDYLTKSVSKLSANFIVPAVNSTVRIIVDDIEGMPATQCFANNDYIRFRAFNRTSGLTIANVWGTVVLDTTYGSNGFLNGTQAYTFTCKATSGAGLTVFKGSEVLDYGTSGSGMISRTTLDAQGSPYEQIATWQSDPSVSTNYTVHARLGNLNGIANCSGFGLYTDNGFFTKNVVIGDLTKNANFLSFDQTNGLQIKLGGTSVATTTDVSTAVNNVQIGGRNILLNSSLMVLNKWALNGSGTTINTDKTINGNNSVLINYSNLSANSYCGLKYANIYDITKNVPYSFSINSYTTDTTTIDIGAVMEISGVDSSNNKIVGKAISIKPTSNNTWKLFKLENVVFPDSVVKVIVSYYLIRNGILYVSSPMAEQSTKCSSWSPAPEDIDASIASAQSTAVSTAATNAAALYVTQSTYNSYVTVTNSAIQAKVSQTDFNALGTRVGSAESTITQHSTDIASKVAQTDYTGNAIASLINQTATTVAISASKINLLGAVTFSMFNSDVQVTINDKATTGYVDTAKSDAITNATNQINAIQVGGRNLAQGTSQFTGGNIAPNYNGYGNSVASETFRGNKVYKVTSDYYGFRFPTLADTIQPTIISFYAKVDSGTTATFVSPAANNNGQIYVTSYGHSDTELINSTTWKQYYIYFPNGCKFYDPNSAVGIVEFFFTTGCYYTSVKVELSTKPTDYTVAPEDVDGSIVSAQQAAQTYATTNCVKTDASNAPNTILNSVLANLHGNFTNIDGSSIYTGTLTAYQVNAVAINANSISTGTLSADRLDANSIDASKLIAGSVTAYQMAANSITSDKIFAGAVTADKIAANTITANQINATSVSTAIATVISLDAARITTGTLAADRIAANSITFGKLVGTDITALGNVTAGSFNIGSGKFVVDANGNTTTVNMTAVNATISGTLVGVSGSFDYLQAVGSSGRLVFGTHGMTFEDEDISQQGMKNSRTLRYYSANIRCRGSFGASSLNMARVHDTVIDYYVNGYTNSYVRFNLQSNGVGGYYIPLYPTSDTGYSLSYGNAALGDVYGFPVDLLIFDNSIIYQYEMIAGSTGKKVIAANANNNINIYLAINGNLTWFLHSGEVQTFINIRELTNPLIASSVHGGGWMLLSQYDNNWS